ncbi:apoptotic chromatin condensation inducer in the nucleus isoform X3 [Brienomyrus brachyistius]|uniref:apoptotic chromatin condensation inducer in the nucleus isoform X3 n=1 Tax=Brienomyrus brachyistius TaxID=42636 RepID=UPI0020B2A354|nr:apoptotic chromatin condensation inducer in the nucleus isoform X3 [Brienomyrus brachyistius]
MAELEDVTLDGRPLHSLRVADLKAALAQRGLSKSGQKNALIKRLKGALMLENLQRTSTPHIGLQPNSQIGEEMSQNSFIKQYLAKQQELLRQRLEREAREAAEVDETDTPAGRDQEEHTSGNDTCAPSGQEVSPAQDDQRKQQAPPYPGIRVEEGGSHGGSGEDSRVRDGEGPQPSAPISKYYTQRAAHHNAHDGQVGAPLAPDHRTLHFSGGVSRGEQEAHQPAAALPRVVASLSVRVVGEPERAGTAFPGPPRESLPSRSTAEPAQRAQEGSARPESDEDSFDEDDDKEEEEGVGMRRRRGEPPSRSRARERARRTRQMPQRIVQPQLPHQPQLQLRQPTPPPSPPPELSFPLPDTPKQSPPNVEEPSGAAVGAGMPVPPQRGSLSPALQRQDSSSSSGTSSSNSRSSSPEPQGGARERKPGPLTLLARKMESEGAFDGGKGKGNLEFEDLPEGANSQKYSAAAVATITSVDGTGLFPGTNIMGKGSGIPVPMGAGTLPTIMFSGTASTHVPGVSVAAKIGERQERIVEERNVCLFEQMSVESSPQTDFPIEQQTQDFRGREKVLEREERIKQQELEREKLEKEKQEQLERQERERQEQERLERERQEQERLERERLERERLERERLERERREQQERLERERLEQERLERERLERERLERERLEQERLERERQEQERLERERQERLERERLEQERLEKERKEQERLEKERKEQERQERVRLEREKLERERLERERLERERLERERLERERLERERLERERLEREKLERERLERERLERERLERERLEREKLERERLEREKLERERLEREKLEREREKLERERLEREKLERERLERERLEREQLERERLEQERLERERREQERQERLEQERLEKERQELEREKALVRERESRLPPWKRGREIGGFSSSLHPVSTLPTAADKCVESMDKDLERQEPVTAHSQLQALGENQPCIPVSPQSSKKFHFLRESRLLSSPSTATPVIKRPRTFSDTPPSVEKEGGTKSIIPEGTSGTQKDIDADFHTYTVIADTQELQKTLPQQGGHAGPLQTDDLGSPWLDEKGISTKLCEPNQQESVDELKPLKEVESTQKEKQKVAEVPKGALELSLPALPPSPPPEEAEVGREDEKEEQSSHSDSSSSDSDSGSSSSSCSSGSSSSSSSSSSQDQSISVSSNRKSTSTLGETQDSKKPVQPEGSLKATSGAQRKRTAREEEDGVSTEVRHSKKPRAERTGEEWEDRDMDDDDDAKMEVTPSHSSREVKQATADVPGPDIEVASDSNEGPAEESSTAKTFPVRKISLSASGKLSPGATPATTPPAAPLGSPTEADSSALAGRKRRWGSSAAVTAKKPSISITTDSLKSLIPDIKPTGGQEAVVELHPDEGRLSGDEEVAEREEMGEAELDKGLKIQRTVTQVVPAESQENGQEETRREEDKELPEIEKSQEESKEEKDIPMPVPMEMQAPAAACEADMKKVPPSDTLLRRSISQQKTGVSITIDDPLPSTKQPSPPRGKITNIVHVCNLVRPFTLGQLKELLSRTGTLLEEDFWIDKIKSHCYVTYSSTEEALATRSALHGVKWPQSNPKFLSVDFAEKEEVDFHRGLVVPERGPGEEPPGPAARPLERDQRAEREREMERRERARGEREWDRDKVRDFGRPGEEREGAERRSRSRDRERRRKERGKSKERKADKKEKAPEEPPAKLLDDLFYKTKAAPCIYWLPLTDEQVVQREKERAERMKEREKRRKEMQEEEERKREEERKERMKGREKEGGGGSGATEGGGRGDGERERERGRERDRERERDGEKKKEAQRSRGGESRATGGSSGARRSRSRSNPPGRDRRH